MPKMPAKDKESTGSIVTTFFSMIKSIVLTARSFLFAFYYPKFVDAVYNEKAIPFRTEIFGDIDTVIPSDKESGQIRILEIGIGPGKNLNKILIYVNIAWSFFFIYLRV